MAHASCQHIQQNRLAAAAEMGADPVGECQSHARESHAAESGGAMRLCRAIAELDRRDGQMAPFLLDLSAPVVVGRVGYARGPEERLEGHPAFIEPALQFFKL